MTDTCHRCGSVGGFGCYECIPNTTPRAKADAWVAAAYEAAAKAAKKDAESGDISDGAAQWVIDTIRALTPDDARVALEAMLAEAEKRGMLRAAEIVRERWASTNADIEAAIRAEVETEE